MRKDPLRRAGTMGAVALGAAFYWQWLNVSPNVHVQTPVMPSPNAHDVLYAAAKLELDDTKVSEAHVAGPSKDNHVYTLAEKEALVAENAPALEGLRAALPMPFWNPPVRSIDTLMPEFAKYRALSRLLLLESQVRAARGDNAGAMSSCLDSVEMGLKVPRGGVLIAALVGIACESIGEKPMWGLVDRLNADEAAAAANRLEALTDQRFRFSDTVQEEGWYGEAMLSEAFAHRSTFAAYNHLFKITRIGGSGEDDGWDTQSAAAKLHAYSSLLTHSKRRIIADYMATVAATRQRAEKPVQFANEGISVGSDPFNQILFPVWTQMRFKHVDARMRSGLLLNVLALRAYRMRHGAYPATLADLVSDGLLRRTPKDPYSRTPGAAFGYRRDSADKYTLYSVGADGIDDGGTPVKIKQTTNSTRTWPEEGDKGDWVVGVNIGGAEVSAAAN